ncbi:MAG TPA: enoyl-CoA hydratase-related protein [Candidatus Melainabacteria bacterium]|nr:enoyl-CoA hydratase-related protein [Candidatus Melainabacteria bacterium]
MNNGFEVDRKGSGARIILNRPEKKNALLPAFWRDFPAAVQEISDSGSHRVLIISARGDDFCAGMDLSVFRANSKLSTGTPRDREHLFHLIKSLQNSLTILEETRIPVIASISGYCLGAGLDLVSACDLRYATKNSVFRIEETNIGIMADLGSLQRLPKLIPLAVSKEMAFRGNSLSAERAYEIGLINQLFDSIDDLEKGVLEIAEEIADKPPLVISASKQSLNYAQDHPVKDALNQAALTQSIIFSLEEIHGYLASKKGQGEAPGDLEKQSRTLDN